MYENYCRIRDERGVTDYIVARETGLNQSVFSDWKKGKSTPKTEKLLRIARYFGISLDYLVTGQKTPAEATKTAQGPHYSRQVWELLVEAEKATTDDLRATTEMLRRLNAYAAMIREQEERGNDAES